MWLEYLKDVMNNVVARWQACIDTDNISDHYANYNNTRCLKKIHMKTFVCH